jgi:hypothetical protein
LLRALNLLVVAVNGSLILLDLLLIASVLLVLLALHVIADQRTGAESECATDSGTGTWVTHCRSDNSARCGAAQGADSRSFFPGGQRSAGAACEDHSSQRQPRPLS